MEHSGKEEEQGTQQGKRKSYCIVREEREEGGAKEGKQGEANSIFESGEAGGPA